MLANKSWTVALCVTMWVCVVIGGGCNGGGGTPSPPPSTITSVAASCVPTSVLVSQTSQCSSAVQGTGNFDSSVTWSASGGTINSSGLLTAPASVGTVNITATSKQDPTKNGPAAVTVNPLAPLTVSISAAATVVLGGSQPLTASSNDPGATFTWSLTGPGSLSSGGANVTYSVPTAVPSVWAATVTVTAKNALNQTATAMAQVALDYPAVSFTGAVPRNIFSVREGFASVAFSGSGFYSGCMVSFDGGTPSPLPPNATLNQFTIGIIFDSNHFDPRGHTIVVDCTANGHGSGKSAAFGFSFIGNQNVIALSSTQIFFLDQGAGSVHVYDLTTGAFVRDINVGRLTDGIGIGDDGFLYLTQSNGIDLEVIGNPTIFPSIPAISLPLGVSEKNGYAVMTQDQGNLLTCVNVKQANPPVVSIAIGSTPMEVVMTATASGLSAVVMNAGDGTLAVAPVPLPTTGQTIPSVHLPGMTTGHGEQTGESGGTYLEVLEYSTNTTPAVQVRIAAPLSRFDRLIWFVDVSNPSQSLPITGPFTLLGDPYRLAVDTANRVFVAAMLDYAADGSVITRFARIDPSGGMPINLNSTVPFVAAGLAVNPVSGQIIACDGATCLQVPNN